MFFNKISDLTKIHYALVHLKFPSTMLHGQMNQEQRLKSLERFKTSAARIMLATDVAARGLDIDGVQCVINYSIPQSAKEYVHRVGRTARAGKAGVSFCIVSQADIGAFQSIEEAINVRMEKYLYNKTKLASSRDTVTAAMRVADQVIKGRMKEEEL